MVTAPDANKCSDCNDSLQEGMQFLDSTAVSVLLQAHQEFQFQRCAAPDAAHMAEIDCDRIVPQNCSRPGTATTWRPGTASRPPTRAAAGHRPSLALLQLPLSSRAPPSPAAANAEERLGSLIWLALGTLTNLAEASGVAPKVAARGIVPVLARLLPGRNRHVEQLALTLLLRLSVLDHVPADIIAAGLMPHILGSIAGAAHQTADLALRLLHNLSFDEKSRAAMVSAGAIPKVDTSQPHSSEAMVSRLQPLNRKCLSGAQSARCTPLRASL